MMMPLPKRRDPVALVLLPVFAAIGLLRLPLASILLIAFHSALWWPSFSEGVHREFAMGTLLTLAWTFGLMFRLPPVEQI